MSLGVMSIPLKTVDNLSFRLSGHSGRAANVHINMYIHSSDARSNSFPLILADNLMVDTLRAVSTTLPMPNISSASPSVREAPFIDMQISSKRHVNNSFSFSCARWLIRITRYKHW